MFVVVSLIMLSLVGCMETDNQSVVVENQNSDGSSEEVVQAKQSMLSEKDILNMENVDGISSDILEDFNKLSVEAKNALLENTNLLEKYVADFQFRHLLSRVNEWGFDLDAEMIEWLAEHPNAAITVE